MARLNIDYDELKKDERIYPGLVDRLGEADALLLLIRFWNSSQKCWAMGDLKPKGRPLGRIQVSDEVVCDWAQLVPYEKFRLLHPKADELFETGLAQLVGHGSEQRVYACGAKERFKWYRAICLNGQSGVDARQAAAGEPKGHPAARSTPADEDTLAALLEEPKGRPNGQPVGEPKGRPKGEPSSSLSLLSSSNTPHTPRPAGGTTKPKVSKRHCATAAADQARLLGLAVTDAYRKGEVPKDLMAASEAKLEPLVRELLLMRYPSWLAFCREYFAARKHAKRQTDFEGDMKASFRANLDEAARRIRVRDGPEAELNRDDTIDGGGGEHER